MEDYQLLHDLLVEELTPLYDQREAATIARYVFEDAFGKKPQAYKQAVGMAEIEQYNKLKHALIALRKPWQYAVGTADFYGYKLRVNEHVLIPRPETEELVHWLLETHDAKARTVLDVGTGSGCIPITLALRRKAWTVHALDVEQAALEVARENAYRLDAPVKFFGFDALDASRYPTLPTVDILVSNPPYILSAERDQMPAHVLDHEPEQALFVTGGDALQFYKALAAMGRTCLSAGGYLYLECNEHHAGAVAALLRERGYAQVELQRDMQGKERMVRGRLERD